MGLIEPESPVDARLKVNLSYWKEMVGVARIELATPAMSTY